MIQGFDMSYYEYHVARRYVQFEGALKELANYATLVGRRILFLTACDPVREQVVAQIQSGMAMPARECMNERLVKESQRYARYLSMSEQFDRERAVSEYEFFDLGETVVSEENIIKVARYAGEHHFDTVVGIGGGKAQDFARAITHILPVHVILVPTLCATNASISTLSVLYSPDGARIQQYWRMDNAPDLVLVDTDLLVRNPPRMLAAGIGDITATYYEALCNLRMSGKTASIPVYAEEGIRLAIRVMREHAPAAMEAIRARKINRSFETVLSMIMHNPGPLGMICLTGYAHMIDEMLLYFKQAHATPHGLRVGYATLAMLTAQNAEKQEMKEYLHFCRSVGIPVSLEALGLHGISMDEWKKAYDATLGISGNARSLPFQTSAESMISSIFEAERFVSEADDSQVICAFSDGKA